MKDMLGATCSGLCVAHCLLTPLLIVGGMGALGDLLRSELVHQALLVPVVLLALLSFPVSARRHGAVHPAALGFTGVGLLLAGQAFHRWEIPLTLVGGLLVVAAHWSNHRLLRARPAVAEGG